MEKADNQSSSESDESDGESDGTSDGDDEEDVDMEEEAVIVPTPTTANVMSFEGFEEQEEDAAFMFFDGF